MPTRLFCFPCAGSSAAGYLRWRHAVPEWLQIEPIELPGRGIRTAEAMVRDFQTLSTALTADLIGRLSKSYALLGHSLGGLLAYDCAVRLQRLRHSPPAALIIACTAAPSLQDARGRPKDRSEADLLRELREQKGTPEEVLEDEDLRRLTLSALDADLSVRDSFHRQADTEPLPCPIYVCGGRNDAVTQEMLSGWERETAGRCHVKLFDGGHFFLRERPEVFLNHLTAVLSPG